MTNLISKISIGKYGEDVATAYLKKQGFKVIERNFKARYEEIDIIAIKDSVLVFIEVKTRTSNKYGTPLEAITYWKLKSLIKAAEFYKLTHPKLPEALRIDAVSVVLNSEGEVENIEHAPNISGF